MNQHKEEENWRPTTIKDFFGTILTRVAGLGLEPQTIEAEAGKKRRGRRGRDRGRGRGRNPAYQ